MAPWAPQGPLLERAAYIGFLLLRSVSDVEHLAPERKDAKLVAAYDCKARNG